MSRFKRKLANSIYPPFSKDRSKLRSIWDERANLDWHGFLIFNYKNKHHEL